MEDLNITNLLKKINLTEAEYRIALKLFDIVADAFQEFVKKDPASDRKNNKNNEKRDIVEVKKAHKKLLRVIDLVNNDYSAASKKFKKNFREWEKLRKEAVELLKSIVDQMQYDKKVCNILSITGGAVAFVSGITTILTIAFPPAAAVTVPLAASCIAAGAVGGGTSGAAYVADFSLVVKHFKHAQAVVQKEKDSDLLGDFMYRTAELEKAMADLLSFDIWTQLWENLKDFCRERKKLSEKFDVFVNAVKMCVDVVYKALPWYVAFGISAASAILTTVIALILFHSQTQSALHIHTPVLGVLRVINAGLEVAKLISLAAKTGGSAAAKLIPQVLAKQVMFGALAGFGAVLDLTMIVLSSVELHKNKLCKEGQQILSLAELLEDERVTLRSVYEGLTKVK